jgi:hypothetical protein
MKRERSRGELPRLGRGSSAWQRPQYSTLDQ